MKAGIISLGCAKNLVDAEVMLGLLQKGGVELTKEPEEADILIVNTCAFIETAKQESITTVLNMAEYKTTGKCRSLIVAGCLGQRYGQALLDEMPEADAIVGTGAWNRIMEAVQETLRGNRVILAGESEIIYDARMPRILATPGYTAYLKIAEGCDNRCSFCAIPMIRGRYRSRPVEDIVAEAKALAAQGAKELNLVAQDTTAYGKDIYGKAELPRLLKELARIEEVRWIRCLYSYPRFFSDELIDVIASEPKLVKYVDLPLQHADDALLKKMRRADTRASMEALLAKLRARIPGVAIRSTFIVGFPGETDEQFAALYSFLEEQRFDKAGIFTYSAEDGTPAAKLPGRMSEDVMQARYHELMSLQCKISEEVNRSLEGKVLDVLVEGREAEQENVAYGRSYREAPEVDGQVFIEGCGDAQPGDMMRVRVSQGFTYDVVGEPTEPQN
ncbi:MAG: 30S ribosomal protein S12 methylthiotransferase RimO [Schwartzia sp.]|nr:30S ribosomal protein S12 methylthiotransferase RimO [Schwartzia sp. (in: firmicutes)]